MKSMQNLFHAHGATIVTALMLTFAVVLAARNDWQRSSAAVAVSSVGP